MRRWMFVALIALCVAACERKDSGLPIASDNVFHVTCVSGGQVIYEGDLKKIGIDGTPWYFVDTKTNVKFLDMRGTSNDCYWTNVPFYKANR